jgi:hypothetical protein
MSTTSTAFFASEQNSAAIRNFQATLRSLQPLDEPNPEVVRPLTTFFGIFCQNLPAFDEHCPANIEWLGKRYIGQLIHFVEERSEKPNEQLLDIFTTSYRLLCELEFSQPGDLSFELRGIKSFVDENLEKFRGADRQQLIFANYTMPANLTKRFLQHTSLADFKAFAETANSAKELKIKWDREISAKTAEIEGLQAAIDRLQTKYNFVGLVKGFEILVARKQSQSLMTFLSILALGSLMLLPVCVKLWFVLNNIEKIEDHRATLVYSLPPLLALELILLYFFRVVIMNYRDLKAQLLQLDLRVSLCQFIQSYSEYSTKIKKQDAGALERFEAIIFSTITSSAEATPTTFDRVDQISKLVSSIRSK